MYARFPLESPCATLQFVEFSCGRRMDVCAVLPARARARGLGARCSGVAVPRRLQGCTVGAISRGGTAAPADRIPFTYCIFLWRLPTAHPFTCHLLYLSLHSDYLLPLPLHSDCLLHLSLHSNHLLHLPLGLCSKWHMVTWNRWQLPTAQSQPPGRSHPVATPRSQPPGRNGSIATDRSQWPGRSGIDCAVSGPSL